jgi:hypothetical protein
MKTILVDESVFVFANRADIPLYSQLMLFLGLSDSKDPQRQFSLVMADVSEARLGMYWFYHLTRYVFLGMKRIEGFEKRKRRRKAARKHVGHAWSVPMRPARIFASFIPGHNKRCLMDLFLYANEARAKEFIKEGKYMEPNQVIPLETCRIAQIAYQRNIPIFSFNRDFKYFCGLPNKPGKYIDYLDPDSFLPHLTSRS